jgi:cell wall-associated NlpC family hydrolase
MVGAADCLGLLLLVARDLGYLPPGFDINLHRPRAADGHTKMSAKEAVYHGLRHNLIETAEPRPGEFLLFLEEIDNAPYHMAIMTCEADTGAPNGWMIHAINHRVSRELGGVVEVPISAIMQRQLLSAWQLPGVDD